MIAQRFGFTRNFLKERHGPLPVRLKKISCGFKDQARVRHLMDYLG
jgi:hypothetical protein